ncbi:MAG TPA: hypothetical protein EYG46_02610 [Myxococcales bacterium]|nr:hypothetical protein [Myxococcales bacterium]HIL99873.1 hypothetical protein [Myxococcales bacterium]
MRLDLPQMGLGHVAPSTAPLLLGGWLNAPLFGGSGEIVLPFIAPQGSYATQVPYLISNNYHVAFDYNGLHVVETIAIAPLNVPVYILAPPLPPVPGLFGPGLAGLVMMLAGSGFFRRRRGAV